MRHILLFGALCFYSIRLPAQDLTAADTVAIQQRAVRYVQQFESLLNLVAQPDKYFRKYSFAKLIRSFYEDQSNHRIFRDSLVTIEDDLNPDVQPDANNLLTVKDYLKTFFSLYDKSPVASVFFSNYEVSSVQQGNFTYVEVFFDSEFTNSHRFYPDQSYPRRRKKATLRAQQQDDDWQVNITDVSYIPSEENRPVATEDTEPKEEAIAASDTNLVAQLPSPKIPNEDALRAVPDSSLSLATSGNVSLENLSETLSSDSIQTEQIFEYLARNSGYQLPSYESAADSTLSVSLDRLPTVSVTYENEAVKEGADSYEEFDPLVRRFGASSVQIILDNPAQDRLFVKLSGPRGETLFTDRVRGRQEYVKAIDLKNLSYGIYQVTVSNQEYYYTKEFQYQ